jgi:LPS export ABC transporter permease LptF
MLKSVDRYLLREMVFPFFAAVFGFILYIVLSFVLQFWQYLGDRNISLFKVLEILMYRLPELAVLSLAISMLFSIFLAIGRLAHDHETIAFQASGISLRRLTIPLIAAGLVISLVAFSINEFWAPKATHRYYILLREMQIWAPVPQVHQNVFFRVPDDRTFYVKNYEYEEKRMEHILIIDNSNQPGFAGSESEYPKTITAKTGYWEGLSWTLKDGVVHQFDQDGRLSEILEFQSLTVEIGMEFDESFLKQLTPAEMTLGEIWQRIQSLKKSGLSFSGLTVEFHSRISIPLAALIFALFAAPLSLIFGQAGAPRGRAVGIVLGILLAAMAQGTLLWGQILGRQETIPPELGPWLPHILFGSVGLVLLVWMDPLSRIDLLYRSGNLFRVFRKAS